MLGPNTYRLVGKGGQVEEIVAADQLKPYHSESLEPLELDDEGNSEPASPNELPVPSDTGAIPKRPRGKPPWLRPEASAPVAPPPLVQVAARTPRRGRDRPRKNP